MKLLCEIYIPNVSGCVWSHSSFIASYLNTILSKNYKWHLISFFFFFKERIVTRPKLIIAIEEVLSNIWEFYISNVSGCVQLRTSSLKNISRDNLVHCTVSQIMIET